MVKEESRKTEKGKQRKIFSETETENRHIRNREICLAALKD